MTAARASLAVLALAVLTSIAVGCTSTPETAPETPAEISIGGDRNPVFGKDVAAIQADPVVRDGYTTMLVGAAFLKSTGDVLKDSVSVGDVLQSDFLDGASLGFDIGLAESSDEAIAKKDAYLCLLLEYQLPKESSQRDSVIPSSDLAASDDQGEQLELLHFSNDGEYIDSDHPFAVVVFKAYHDSDTIELTVDGKPYLLDVGALAAPK